MSYSNDIVDMFRRLAAKSLTFSRAKNRRTFRYYQATKFELVINLKTAKSQGIDVPPTLLARADEIIE